MESNKAFQHPSCLIKWTIPIILAHSILLKVVVLQHPSHLQRDFVVFSQRTLTDELHYLCKVFFLLKDLFGTCAESDESWVRVFVVRLKYFGVLGV